MNDNQKEKRKDTNPIKRDHGKMESIFSRLAAHNQQDRVNKTKKQKEIQLNTTKENTVS